MRKILLALGIALSALGFCQTPDGTGYVLQPPTLIDNFNSNGWKKWDLGDMDYVTTPKFGKGLRMRSYIGQEVLGRKAVTLDLTNVQTFSFWVYISQPAQYDLSAVVGISFTQDNFYSEVEASTDNLRQGWNKVTFSRADFVSKNGGKWGVMNGIQLRLYDMGWNTEAIFDELSMNEFTRPKVIISFDDAYDDHYTEAYQYMKSKGLVGTAYINTGFLGKPGRLTVQQAQEMYDNGWDLANHTENHADLITLTKAQQEKEIENAKNFMIERGWTRRDMHLHHAYPYGHYNEDSFQALENQGFYTARTTWEARQANVLDEKYLLYGQLPDSHRSTVAGLKELLDKQLLVGGVYELSFHMIVPEPEVPTEFSRQGFREMVDYIANLKAQGKVDVVTKTEWYESLQVPQVEDFTLNTYSVESGESVTATVKLKNFAPQGGAEVKILENFSTIIAPTSVVVPKDQKTASFTIETFNVYTTTDYIIKVSLGGVTKQVVLRVIPQPKLINHTISPSEMYAGNVAVGKLKISSNAKKDMVISLTPSKPNITIPSSVVIPAGKNEVSYNILSSDVVASTNCVVTAKLNTVTMNAGVIVRPNPVLVGFSLNKTEVVGGTSVTGTINLSPAPSINTPLAIVVESNLNKAMVPKVIATQVGVNKYTFQINTVAVPYPMTATIRVTLGSVSKTVQLKLTK